MKSRRKLIQSTFVLITGIFVSIYSYSYDIINEIKSDSIHDEVTSTVINDVDNKQVRDKNNFSVVENEFICVYEIKTDLCIIDSTAYYNKYNSTCADGTWPYYGVLAGKREWIGKSVNLYYVDENGDVGDFIGTFEFHDTGYGIDGDIERGETIDIFFDSYEECVDWGRRNVYIEWINQEQ